ncbi:MAG: hypothetical protein R2734_15685 [Nocardioides sp.]
MAHLASPDGLTSWPASWPTGWRPTWVAAGLVHRFLAVLGAHVGPGMVAVRGTALSASGGCPAGFRPLRAGAVTAPRWAPPRA